MNLQETLKHYFGYDSLRLGQQELIDEILKGKDVLGICLLYTSIPICTHKFPDFPHNNHTPQDMENRRNAIDMRATGIVRRIDDLGLSLIHI